jgi:hypothetical protein
MALAGNKADLASKKKIEAEVRCTLLPLSWFFGSRNFVSSKALLKCIALTEWFVLHGNFCQNCSKCERVIL